jgi:hypothetical protein
MVSNQTLKVRLALRLSAGLVGLALLPACSSLGNGQKGAAPTPAATPIASVGAEGAAAQPQTVTDNLGDAETTTVISDTSQVLNASAPMSYTVKRGDTLWGIAGMFLKDPWLWPEIWYVNPQVENPHRIYPGDMLRLAYGADGKAQLQLVRGPGTRLSPLLRSEPLEGAILTIPFAAIGSFLARPSMLSREEVEAAPYVQEIRDSHIVAGVGHDVYVKKLKAGVGERFNVIHVGDPLKDPDSHRSYGYLGVYAGTVQVSRTGDPATATLVESGRETLRGDVLVPSSGATVLELRPHAPSGSVTGQIMAVVNGVLLASNYQVVALNRGTGDGVEPGHVLRALKVGQVIRDQCARIAGAGTCRHIRSDELPTERISNLLVFKTYERMSFALVLDETSAIHVGDEFANP